MLGNSLKKQYRLEDALLIHVQLLVCAASEIIQHSPDIMRQKVPSLVVEELPEHVYCQKRIVVFRPVVINKPLEAFYLIPSVVLDKVKHTSLVRIKSR